MVNFILGEQAGYTKYPFSFVCGIAGIMNNTGKRRIDPHVTSLLWGRKNITNEPLVNCNRIILPPLHIKLGLMKQFVKALIKEGSCFSYICKAFSGLNNEKLKAEIFDGKQI